MLYTAKLDATFVLFTSQIVSSSYLGRYGCVYCLNQYFRRALKTMSQSQLESFGLRGVNSSMMIPRQTALDFPSRLRLQPTVSVWIYWLLEPF